MMPSIYLGEPLEPRICVSPLNGVDVRKTWPRGFKKRPRGFKKRPRGFKKRLRGFK
jgi:hypothetical protein